MEDTIIEAKDYREGPPVSVEESAALHEVTPVGPPQLLVALDGSRLAELVLPHAISLAQALSAGIHLLRVVQEQDAVWPAFGAVPPSEMIDEIWKADLNEAEKYVTELAEKLRKEGLAVSTEVDEGDPATAILLAAKEHPEVAAVAMATHGRSGFSRWVFGSVAEKVLRASPKPLLLVCTRSAGKSQEPIALEAHPYSTVLVPLDGSAFAEQALDEARLLAQTCKAKLVLVSAVPPRESMEILAEAALPSPSVTVWQSESEGSYNYLDEIAHKIRPLAPGVEIQTRVLHGDAAEVILKVADDAKADMIVMATHGRGGLQRLWLGSVALKVVQGTCTPVVLVRAK